jgi:hypothetical protein
MKMNMKTITSLNFPKLLISCLFLIATLLPLVSCDNDDPDPVNEEELITTVKLTFQKLDAMSAPTGNPITYSWQDIDGSGANAPVINSIMLNANSTYTVTIALLDESKNPVEDISEEVEEEGEAHQFFFQKSATLNLNTTYGDLDSNSFPIGLKNTITTTNASTGTLTVTLRHEPVKDAAGVKDGNMANAGGDTDVEAVFPATIN